ncbi:N-acetylmuramoyl-L-alanine amidase [Flavobacteriaceae bacterium F89]|uniref:N-acetylmuramoyl-L-alanine amidase n=1 Tax=Cerina litoralis TaxID=2874477 RepID=A0AAE3ETI3_9FLAO|nr:N-acetylmuramoyl-L-alanine amidase [Cerina litoralis]MCG2459934.1 N-acetylmuramoyl-L-alanine amidase [Cerina litoralis]
MDFFRNRAILFFAFLLFVFKVFPQDTLQTVIARQGDGIYSLLRKQGIDPTKHYREFIELNRESLGVDDQLLVDKAYRIPSVKVDSLTVVDSIQKISKDLKPVDGVEYSIFGPEHSLVLNVSDKLEGAVYYLVSGHGGPDPGAVEQYDGKIIAEDEYAYDVTLRLAKELLANGAKVYIIVRDPDDGIRDQMALEIDRDEVVYPNEVIPLNQLSRLEQRVEVVNELYKEHTGHYQRLIVTHVDSRSEGTNIDVFFYYHEDSKNGQRLAENIHKTFHDKYATYQPNRDYLGTFSDRSNLYLVKKTLPAMVYIELGNIRNKKDQKRILDPENRQALAKWIAEGVMLDFDTK